MALSIWSKILKIPVLGINKKCFFFGGGGGFESLENSCLIVVVYLSKMICAELILPFLPGFFLLISQNSIPVLINSPMEGSFLLLSFRC